MKNDGDRAANLKRKPYKKELVINNNTYWDF